MSDSLSYSYYIYHMLKHIENSSVGILTIDQDDLKHFRIWEELGTVGRMIGNVVEEITMENHRGLDSLISGISEEEMEEFYAGIAQGLSIKEIEFSNCHVSGHILKLFDTENVDVLRFRNCKMTSQTTGAIRRRPRLKILEFEGEIEFEDVDDSANFIPLNNKYDLEVIYIRNLRMNELGLLALVDLTSDLISNTLSLKFFECGDEVLWQLRPFLVNSSSLQEMEFCCNEGTVMTEEGWQVVSDVLSSPVTALTSLIMSSGNMHVESAVALASGLACNATLEYIEFTTVGVVAAGWPSIMSALQNPNLRLKDIRVADIPTMNDEVLTSLVDVLISKRDSIERFDVVDCHEITAAGWLALSAAFVTPMPNLWKLGMGNANFDDDATVALARVLNNIPSMTYLSLRWAIITTTGWGALSKSLCDTSSADAIRKSHHTLDSIENYCKRPPSINMLLDMNRKCRGNPSNAARLKMVQYSDKINIECLVDDEPELQTKLVPGVLSWLGENPQKQTALFHFIRNHVSLFESASKDCSRDIVAKKSSLNRVSKRKHGLIC
ncbi:hypothetical protein HJC23_004469 [Cyclotella cryptica]|uniref:Uncharacterized protein n=1 Tax=Cyclotella cryptica TaxID=29204 RepID=A0ABD3QFR8_9STRA|eukprot:CCRYP_006094-RA/>CCRYP_006094-RA protein AED:0.21 eAED:0.21 QI:0/-1/0/1/-1/1/1/0/552